MDIVQSAAFYKFYMSSWDEIKTDEEKKGCERSDLEFWYRGLESSRWDLEICYRDLKFSSWDFEVYLFRSRVVTLRFKNFRSYNILSFCAAILSSGVEITEVTKILSSAGLILSFGAKISIFVTDILNSGAEILKSAAKILSSGSEIKSSVAEVLSSPYEIILYRL